MPRLSALLLVGFGLMATRGAVAADTDACLALPIYVVDNVGCTVSGHHITISAEGRTRTSGWSAPRLQLQAKAADGHAATVVFLACHPSGMVLEALWKTSARLDFDDDSLASLEEVTVTAESNARTGPCRIHHPPAVAP